MTNPARKTITFVGDEELHAQLVETAKREDRSLSAVLRQAVRSYVGNQAAASDKELTSA